MKRNNKKGFTIIELSFALIFVTILLITIAYLTIHITSTYQKGLAMKAVNSTAKELIDDFSRAINTSPARTVESLCSKYSGGAQEKCLADSGRKFIYQQRYVKANINGSQEVVPSNGVFCTGRYSYVWNSAYVLNDNSLVNSRASLIAGGAKKSDFRLLKVTDFTRELCESHLDNNYIYDGSSTYSMSSTPEMVKEMLDNTENNLALYEMTIFAPTIHGLTTSGFFSGTFILATLRGDININSTGEFCAEPPDNLDTDFAYCAINKFNFAMRANGEKLFTERWEKDQEK